MRCGCRAVRALYLVNGIAAVGLTVGVWRGMPAAARIVPLAYLGLHVALWRALSRRSGRAINPLLGLTACAMLAYAAAFAVCAALV